MKCLDIEKEILYDKDGIQLIVRKDDKGKDVFTIVENDTFIVLTDLILNRFVKIYTDRWTP